MKKVVVITGAAGLIGQTLAKEVSNAGDIAIIADIDFKKSQEVSSTIKDSYPIELDITSEKSLEAVTTELHEKFGKIDVLINNAYPRNKNYGNHFFDVTYEDFSENISLNLGGYFLTSKVFAKYFKKQGQGNIINISSIYGVIAPKFEVYNNTKMTMPVEYSVIKSGLIHLTKYMSKYFKGLNIKVNSVSPGGILDSQPEKFLQEYKDNCLSKGMLDPIDIAGAVIFLISDSSKYVNGQNIIVDDGFTL